MKVYKVGLIGYGFIGKVHTYGHQNIPLFYDQQDFKSVVTMVCTSRPESAAKAVSGIFSEDKVFVTLFILLLLVIFICAIVIVSLFVKMNDIFPCLRVPESVILKLSVNVNLQNTVVSNDSCLHCSTP